jgi:hypothetical protein
MHYRLHIRGHLDPAWQGEEDVGSLIVMAVALVLGVTSSLLVSRRRRPSQQGQEMAKQSVSDNVSAG